jgi:hypothetical protein
LSAVEQAVGIRFSEEQIADAAAGKPGRILTERA